MSASYSWEPVIRQEGGGFLFSLANAIAASYDISVNELDGLELTQSSLGVLRALSVSASNNDKRADIDGMIVALETHGRIVLRVER